MSDRVSYERVGAAALLTITRPERRNAVDEQTADALLAAFNEFEGDDQARALVLTGQGPEAFCAGADLKALAEVDIASMSPEEAAGRLAAREAGPMGFTRLTPSKPAIAAISGWCLAGGMELALWCDLRIATKTARFGFFDRRWGVPLIDGGTVRLPQIVGRGRALDLILTGREMGVTEAFEWGLVNEVVEEEKHVERALEIAEGLAKYPQETLISDRRSMLESFGLDNEAALANEAKIGAEVIDVAIRGAGRFAGGEGRHGEGAGV